MNKAPVWKTLPVPIVYCTSYYRQNSDMCSLVNAMS